MPVLLLAYALLMLALWRVEGIHADKEALKYLGCAEQVLHGDLHDLLGNYLPYGTYILFLLPFVAMGLPLLAVPVQVALSVLAAQALGRLTSRMAGDGRAGTLATGLFLLCIPIQAWTLSLYTESLFTSLLCLLLDQVLAREKPGRWALPLALLVLFGRPVGLLFVGPLLIWWLGARWSPPMRAAACAGVLGVALFNPRVAAPQLEIIAGSDVLCGCGNDPAATVGFHGRSVFDTQVHLVERHGAAPHAMLVMKRFASLFTFTRPSYSRSHNLVLMAYYLLYPLAVAGLWWMRERRLAGPFIAIPAIYALLVGFTCDEWSGRFLVPLLPVIIAPAAMGVMYFLHAQRG